VIRVEINRKFLQELEKEAWKKSQIKGTNQFWASAYRRLAEVACELDAYMARSEEYAKEPAN